MSKPTYYVEFVAIDPKKNVDDIAKAIFGDNANSTEIQSWMGIDLKEYGGFFFNVGVVEAMTGPLIKGRIAPILAIYQEKNTETYKPHIYKATGFIHKDGNRAWIEAEEWNDILNSRTPNA